MGLFSQLFRRNVARESGIGEDAAASVVEGAAVQDTGAGSTTAKSDARKIVPFDSSEDEGAADAVSDNVITEPGDGEDADPTDSVGIWDLEDDGPQGEAVEEQPTGPDDEAIIQVARESAAPARSRRNKTRLLGFDNSDGQVVDLFNNDTAAASSVDPSFPVGWIIVVKGPGLGASFTLQTGMSQIGRGKDQIIQLDFGDTSISRVNHAAIVYDPEANQILLGHGGKSNIVRLNGSPLISNEILKDGDEIQLGETTLRFSAFCNEDFNWSQVTADENAEEDGDVEIA